VVSSTPSSLPRSLWAATASAAVPPDAPLQDETSVDLAIVGGGFTGLSAALHAAEAGAEVAVLESETIGFGASGRNGGQVNPGLKLGEPALAERFGKAGRTLFRLGQEAPDFLADLVARRSLSCRFERHGLIRLAHNDTALATVRLAAAELRSAGVPVEEIDAGEVERRVGTRRYRGGYRDPRGASVHPLDLARELARAATMAGASIHARSPALSITRNRRRWRIATPGGALLADRVLVATNAYTDGLVPGLAASLLPVNSFQIATEPLPAGVVVLPGRETVYDSRRLVLYFRISPDGHLMVGGRASFSSSRVTSASVADYSVLEQALTGIFPQAAGVPISYRWTGLVGITMDYMPHYHVPDQGLHIMLGYNGRGVAMATRAGAFLGRKLAGAPEADDLPVTPIRPVPFHRYRATLLNVGMQWNRVLDFLGR
jgi:glycine/D-amino acid oxidase-like deaminating enzyme